MFGQRVAGKVEAEHLLLFGQPLALIPRVYVGQMAHRDLGLIVVISTEG